MRRHDPTDQPHSECLLCRHALSGQDHLRRFGSPDDSRQSLGAAEPGNEAEFDFWQPQHRSGCRYPNVAGQGEFQPAADAGTVDGSEDGFVRPLNTAEERLTTNSKLRAAMHGIEMSELIYIGPR